MHAVPCRAVTGESRTHDFRIPISSFSLSIGRISSCGLCHHGELMHMVFTNLKCFQSNNAISGSVTYIGEAWWLLIWSGRMVPFGRKILLFISNKKEKNISPSLTEFPSWTQNTDKRKYNNKLFIIIWIDIDKWLESPQNILWTDCLENTEMNEWIRLMWFYDGIPWPYLPFGHWMKCIEALWKRSTRTTNVLTIWRKLWLDKVSIQQTNPLVYVKMARMLESIIKFVIVTARVVFLLRNKTNRLQMNHQPCCYVPNWEQTNSGPRIAVHNFEHTFESFSRITIIQS